MPAAYMGAQDSGRLPHGRDFEHLQCTHARANWHKQLRAHAGEPCLALRHLTCSSAEMDGPREGWRELEEDRRRPLGGDEGREKVEMELSVYDDTCPTVQLQALHSR